MAAAQDPLLALLDLFNEYLHFEQEYDAQFFARFSNRDRFILYALSSRPRVSLFHFFIPDAENALISTRNLFRDKIFYIYCTDETAVETTTERYNYPTFVKVFHAEELAIYLRQAVIGYLVEHAERNRQNPDAYHRSSQAAAQHASRLAEELANHTIMQTGQQPVELL